MSFAIPTSQPTSFAGMNATAAEQVGNVPVQSIRDAQPRLRVIAADGKDSAPQSAYSVLAKRTTEAMEAMQWPGLRAAVRPLPDHHAWHQSRNGRFTISASAWNIFADDGPRCEARMVFIEGTSNAIINTWIFPEAPEALPVFAAELIAMGGAPRLTFMDIQAPVSLGSDFQKLCQATAVLRITYEDIHCDEVPPEWAIEASAGNYIFSRAIEPTKFPQIQSCYMTLLSAYLKLVSETNDIPFESRVREQAKNTLNAYQLHHMHSSPGNVFLGKVFGEEWTADFLTQFLFTLPGELA